MSRFELKGKRALVTGATGGLGQAIARALAAEGVELVLSGRRLGVLEPFAAELGAKVVAADLADEAEVDRLMAESGEIDILVANAALPATGDPRDFTAEEIKRAIQVNLTAPIQMAREAAKAMTSRGGGRIVLVGSLAGISPLPRSAMYNATKYGLRGFVLGFRQDLDGSGVGISIVEPGFVRDAGMFADSGAKLPPGVRLVTPEKVARAVVKAAVKNSPEILVAPAELRFGVQVGAVFPSFNARLLKLAGGEKLGEQLTEGHRLKR